MAVRALWYSRGTLSLLDQRELPSRIVVRKIRTLAATADAIRTMAVRGAPSIGAAAAYGMVLGYREGRVHSGEGGRRSRADATYRPRPIRGDRDRATGVGPRGGCRTRRG